MRSKQVIITTILLALAGGCSAHKGRGAAPQLEPAQIAYKELLAMFPEDRQGEGAETYFPTVTQQPMTYGLILSAEAARQKAQGDKEGPRRIRKAMRWVLDNSDLDLDGLPGWGLPDPWDAFQDGSTNPPNQPYTITTAIVLYGLLDALSIPNLCTASERAEIKAVGRQVILRWCRDIWSDGFGGGYFWYSPSKVDDIFAINSPSMFLGSMLRFVVEQPDAFSATERELVRDRADHLATAAVTTVQLRGGLPFWDYRPGADAQRPSPPNDLIHHIYTLWGVETYRDCGGRVALPWSRAQAVESIDRFWRNGRICSHPQDVTYTGPQAAFVGRAAVLWSAGSMLAGYAKWGGGEQAARTFEAIQRDYGPWPRLQLHPAPKSPSEKFYPRYAAHVLWGLSLYAYSDGCAKW